ncbi:MAG: GNAT family N-acetyltransferase [Rhodospirillales bacterium]|nr:GNAT family N-acetyltransferase [Rhodospirillales bacterium]
METPVLETDRLILRPITLDDAPAVQKYFNNWNIIKNLSLAVPWPYPDDGAESFIRDNVLPSVEKGESIVWVITVKDHGDEAVGVIDYRVDGREEGNRGFWLAEPFWRQGYMTEAVTAMQDYIFFDLDIERMIVMNIHTNEGSRRVKQKNGAQFIGTKELEHREGGSKTEMWEITRESWTAIRKKA